MVQLLIVVSEQQADSKQALAAVQADKTVQQALHLKAQRLQVKSSRTVLPG